MRDYIDGMFHAERGARGLVLASRSGKRAAASAKEWSRLMAKREVEATVQRCDSADDGHVQRLVAITPGRLVGVWHAAGVLADGVVATQSAGGLARVYAPKTHGSWALQLASVEPTNEARGGALCCWLVGTTCCIHLYNA